MSEKRYLILAEGKSADPHYGKTMRGVVAYSPHPTVVILDSERAGEEHEGIPIVATVEEALAYEPDTALVGVATQGGRFRANDPHTTTREQCQSPSTLTSQTARHSSCGTSSAGR